MTLSNHRRNLSRRKYHVHHGQDVVVVGIMHQSSRSCAQRRERQANKILIRYSGESHFLYQLNPLLRFKVQAQMLMHVHIQFFKKIIRNKTFIIKRDLRTRGEIRNPQSPHIKGLKKSPIGEDMN